MLVSIAMTTYNGEQFLREQLDSILAQTYSNFEIIICDDQSMDRTYQILQEFALLDSRIKLFKNDTNLGLVKNFEKALYLCSGQYIALADQDDIWEPEKIETLITNIGHYSLIHSDACLIDSLNEVFAYSYSKYSKKDTNKNFIEYLLSNNVTGCTSLFKRELLQQCLPIPEKVLLHDWWIALNAMKLNGIIYIDKSLTRYRQHHTNQIGASNPTKIASFTQRLIDLEKYLIFLKTIQYTIQLNLDEINFLKSLVNYYEEFFFKTLRFRSFFFHLKNFQHFHKRKSLKFRYSSLILSLFGNRIQKNIWRFLDL